MSIKLFIITAVAAVALGITNAVTEEPIKLQIEQAGVESRKYVLPDAQEFVRIDIAEYQSEFPDIAEVYEGKSSGDTVGYVLKVLSKGYGGNIELFVGIDSLEHKIQNIGIGSHRETPGLGDKAIQSEFLARCAEKSAEGLLTIVSGKPTKAQEVEAITGATITSKAVVRGVNSAMTFYNQVLKDGGADR
jgi:electron transport complex protein RnfG